MMMSMSKVLTDRHVPEKRASRAGLQLFLLLTVLALAGCYPVSYREVSRPMPAYAAGDVFDKIDTDGDLLDDFERVGYAAGPEGIPDLVDLISDLACEHGATCVSV